MSAGQKIRVIDIDKLVLKIVPDKNTTGEE